MSLPVAPSALWAELFVDVQTRGLFPDSKTFADAVPREPADAIMQAYRAAPPMGAATLERFVRRHFDLPAEDAVSPSHATGSSMRARIRALWPALTRPAVTAPPNSSVIGLPRPYVVPGGRFRELYYWDSYFTMLGLRRDGHNELIEDMLDNFCSLIERFGHVPNGTRTYYLGRSQPPLFYAMCGLSRDVRPVVLARRLRAMITEHDFWMAGADEGADGRIVTLADGGRLNRYWDASDGPRDEAYREDLATRARAAGRDVYRHLRAGAESGWDFSSRWLADRATLATIKTADILPIDLNSFLFGLECAIAQCSRQLGLVEDAARFYEYACRRRASVHEQLWDATRGHFVDLDWRQHRAQTDLTAAALSPLFVGLASKAQAAATATVVERDLMARGGLRTTLRETGEQWDAPNGWAPLQWIAVAGLQRYGHERLAREIARRWLTTVDHTFCSGGRMLEKYDIERDRPGGGGEYPLQDGFGWTNGVTAALSDAFSTAEAANMRASSS